MLKNSKNVPKSNSFELLSESNDDESITVETASACGRPLKRMQPFEPNLPPQAKRTNSTKATIPRPASAISSSEQQAEKAEKRIEALEEFIRNELFPRIGTTSTASASSLPLPPLSPPPSIAPRQILGVGLDLSRVAILEIREGNAGTVYKQVNEALKEKGITCLGVNSKWNGCYRLLFHGDNIDKAVNLHDAITVNFMAIYITVTERRLRSVDSVHSRGMRYRHAPRQPLSVHFLRVSHPILGVLELYIFRVLSDGSVVNFRVFRLNADKHKRVEA
ncbi:hypothetical protein OIDMADRAFT_146890 [Oidiodendron maius Zn]|uniref:Uncharacterized protein n=1 Tax=Oidiodendron maius (strain Zn) TaxID=913774 RepID=A0A0C3D8H4_OIDMZ|nr:hypothetical protein OIDMADRAFT_146890 [Oidiodendron maius Zn]